MTDFLLELRSEEIPARMQAGARGELEKLFRAEMQAAGVLRQAQDERDFEVTVWSTPRRLALMARGLPEQTEAVREETKGPRTSAPAQALEGFLRKTGLTQDRLEDRDGVYYAVVEKPGRAVKDVLAEAIPAIVSRFAWPKSMRWGAASLSTESLRWVRPLSGIVAIFGEELVECRVGDVASGYMTLGHRFHCPGPITIGGAADYREKLRACHVIVDHAERQDLIREGARKAAAEAGLALVEDEGLVIENAGLTEWPVPLLGRFDEAFLDVPPEVIQLTARVNQKYFVCQSSPSLSRGGGPPPQAVVEGASGDTPPSAADAAATSPSKLGEDLANAFVCTANIEAADGGAGVVDGNRKVLAARLSDARFFWEQDRKVPLSEHAKKLERITFHEKLGTVADKVERVARLARWLVEEGIVGSNPAPATTDTPLPEGEGLGVGVPTSRASSTPTQPSPSRGRAQLADLAEQAARLAKADLVTEMVGEFPELQGLMGGYYARAEGLPDAVADAIRDHYKPVGQGDEVPTAPVTVAVSLADKLDTLIGFLATGMFPTGSRDPYALRRAAIAILRIDETNELNISWGYAVMIAYIELASSLMKQAYDANLHAKLLNEVRDFEGRTREGLSFEEEVKLASKAAPGATKIIDFKVIIPLFAAFMAERIEAQQRASGVRHDFIEAVFSLGGEVRFGSLVARVKALQSFIKTDDGANLLAAYKRAANILKKEGWSSQSPLPEGEGSGVGGPTPEAADAPTQPSPERGRAPSAETEIPRTGEEDPLALVDDPDLKPVVEARLAEKKKKSLSYTPEPAEKELIEALDSAEPKAAAAVKAEDFEAAMAALATLRGPIDRFFDSVTVNDDDPAKRSARLDLLGRFRAAVHEVADFSKIEG